MKDTIAKLQIHGRTLWDEEKQGLFFNWTCSGVTICFTGTCLRAKLSVLPDRLPPMAGLPESPDYYPWIGVVTDGETLENRQEILSDGWYDLWQGPEGTHTLRLVKLSENARGKLGLMELYTDGQILPAPKNTRRSIEFVGDSITAAFGNESADNAPAFTCKEENGWMSYAAIAARTLGYEWSQVCVSGISTFCPEDPLYPLPGMDEVYHLTDQPYAERCGISAERWCFEEHRSDIVVVNLGTNDVNVPRYNQDFSRNAQIEVQFQDRYGKLLKKIRQLNGPDTRILCCLGPMDYYFYDRILAAVEDYRSTYQDPLVSVYKFLPTNIATEGLGACGHPSKKTHIRMGQELAHLLRSLEANDK